MQGIIDTFGYYFATYCCNCSELNESIIKINGNKFKIIRLLAEGNLKFVYLIKALDVVPYGDEVYYTLKKITCPFGEVESVSDALQEIERYKTFQNPYVIHYLDSQIIQDGSGTKTIYLLLPYYEFGSLQETINRNLLDGTYISENESIRLMIEVCTGLLCLHNPRTRSYNEMDNRKTYHPVVVAPEETEHLLADTPINIDSLRSQDNQLISYSHKNLKPSNLLIASDHTPVMGDLSSCTNANIGFSTPNQISSFKEWVRSHCQLEFAAPELLNPKLHSTIDAKVDIWSLGCTMYTLMFGISPFDREEQLNGTPRKLAIEKGMFTYPSQHRYSQSFIDIINRCIDVNTESRYSTKELLNNLKILQTKK